jgi:hypothetical protein
MDGRKPFFDSEWDRLELIGVLAGLAAFAPLSTDMYLPAFPQIERHFSTDGGSVQLSLSSFFAAFALGSSSSGRFPTVSDGASRSTAGFCSSSSPRWPAWSRRTSPA